MSNFKCRLAAALLTLSISATATAGDIQGVGRACTNPGDIQGVGCSAPNPGEQQTPGATAPITGHVVSYEVSMGVTFIGELLTAIFWN